MSINIINLLKEKLSQGLPGWDAQKLMSPIKTDHYQIVNESAKKAAVLALLYLDDNQDLQLIFIKRPSNNPHDKHGGQVSFPGGQVEKGDRDYEDTALRETYEEIGIEKEKITIIGELTSIYIYVSEFFVQPFLGFMDHPPDYKLQKSEVDFIITSDLNYLISDESKTQCDFKIRSTTFKNMPYFKLDEEILWGATAMITSEIVEILKDLRDTSIKS